VRLRVGTRPRASDMCRRRGLDQVERHGSVASRAIPGCRRRVLWERHCGGKAIRMSERWCREMRPRRMMQTGLLVAVALVCSLVSLGVSAHQVGARTLATCTPSTWVPAFVSHQTKGGGHTECDAGAPNWAYDVRLVNHVGTILAENLHTTQDQSGSGDRWTALTTCTGAIVHNFYYINVGGAGKSDTSGENGPC